jgi:hypothetical protein
MAIFKGKAATDFCERCGDIHPALRCTAADDLDDDDHCTNAGGHEWAYTGTQYGGDDESYHGEGRCYCVWCGADGDA